MWKITEKFPDVDSDNCGAYLNDQDGFDNIQYETKKTTVICL